MLTLEYKGYPVRLFEDVDGAYVALRPVCDSLGLDFSGQLQRLQRQSWAVVGMTPTTGSDGKVYDMTTVDRRTFTMWLATIDTGRVKNEHTRELVRTYQCEAADALDKYFNEGAVISDVGLIVFAARSPKPFSRKLLQWVLDEFTSY